MQLRDDVDRASVIEVVSDGASACGIRQDHTSASGSLVTACPALGECALIIGLNDVFQLSCMDE